MSRTRTTAVMLAGTLRPSPLREAIAMPELCLPVEHERCLLDLWRTVLRGAASLREISIVVNDERDVRNVEDVLSTSSHAPSSAPVHIVVEPASWRGTGGLLRDVTADLDGADLVIVLEATSLPPRTLRPLLSAMRDSPELAGVIGVCGDGEPAGASALRRRALEHVPAVGYFDVKEQLLPLLHARGESVRAVALGERARRVRDRAGYLAAVGDHLATGDGDAGRCSISPAAEVSPAAAFDGFSVIGPGAAVADGAVIHDSVVMAGAVIEGGAIVSRSLVGPGGRVAARARVVGEVVAGAAAGAAAAARPVEATR